jgi:PPOX class probable F420-dependent enzyme
MIPESVRELIATGPLAHLTTLNPDDSPQVTVVWVGIEDDEIVSAHMGAWQKVKNVQRDPRVVLSFLGPETNAMGLREYVVIYGTARVTEGGAAALLQRLARIYISPEAEFPPVSVRDRPGFIVHIRPERYAGVGSWNTA